MRCGGRLDARRVTAAGLRVALVVLGACAAADAEPLAQDAGDGPSTGVDGADAGAAASPGAGPSLVGTDAATATLDPASATSDAGAPSTDPPRADAAAAHDAGSEADAATPMPIDPPTPVGCVTDVSPGVHQFDCDSTVHTVSVPEQCVETACGVIVDVHGGMMSSQMEDKNTDMRALGVAHGYIVIQPNALQNFLLLNQRLFVADAPGAPADDTRVMNILTQVIEAFHVDERRIHMTGFSEGGFMTWRWFCQHSDLLASVAPGAAAWQCGNLANLGLTPPEIGCELTGVSVPARNIPVLYMQGMQDGLVDPACADGWVRNNLFSALALGEGVVLAGDPDFQSAQFVRTRYEDPDGVPFEYIQHQYSTDSAFLGVAIVGHCYPGSTDLTVTLPAETVIPPDQLMAFGCKDDCEFTWGEEVIRFFMEHPKP